MNMKNPNAPATTREGGQVDTIRRLLAERVCGDQGFPARCIAKLDSGTMTMAEASKAISYLMKQPKDPNVKTKFRPRATTQFRTPQPIVSHPYAHGTSVAQASHPASAPPKVTKAGVFKRPDGQIFVVKPNKQGTRVYAKRMVPISAERLNLLGNKVKFEFEYNKGDIYSLDESMRLPEDQVAALCIQYGRCIMCNHPLKAAKSVQRMVGPVCYQRIQGMGFAP